MSDIKKDDLKELLNYHFAVKTLKDYVKEYIDEKFKGRAKLGSVEEMIKGLTTKELINFVFERFYASRHNTHIFEHQSDVSLPQKLIKKAIEKLPLPSIDGVVHVEKGSDGISLNGIWSAMVKAQNVDPDTNEVLGKMRSIAFLLPFRAAFHFPRHFKIKFFKFAPGTTHALLDGTHIHINQVEFDEKAAIKEIRENFLASVAKQTFIVSNLMTGQKKLIKNKYLSAMVASADNKTNDGENRRTKHNSGSGALLEYAWLKKHILVSDKIKKGKWFWIKDEKDLKNTNKLQSVTIDPEVGLMAKDYNRPHDLEWLIDEVIKNNH